jgi:hypothetical protein
MFKNKDIKAILISVGEETANKLPSFLGFDLIKITALEKYVSG